MAISVENRKLSHPRCMTSPLYGFALELGTGTRGQKLEWWGYGPRKKFDDIFSLCGYNTRTWQTDVQTDTGREQRPRLRIASRGKKWILAVNSNTVCVKGDRKSINGRVARWLTFIGLLLIAFGAGGIKPCVAAFGGDQFTADQVSRVAFMVGLSILSTCVAVSSNGGITFVLKCGFLG